jgi:hypothetical protein
MADEKNEKEKQENQKVEIPKGYYVTQVPYDFRRTIALGEKEVMADELLVKIANALTEAGILKE